LIFLVIALLAGILAFGVIAFAAAEIARICFFAFIVLFLVSFISPFFRRTKSLTIRQARQIRFSVDSTKSPVARIHRHAN
jgi:uncharacterized membrane protein YtjA (UPF0391 family)